MHTAWYHLRKVTLSKTILYHGYVEVPHIFKKGIKIYKQNMTNQLPLGE